jgi:hypothetical protein
MAPRRTVSKPRAVAKPRSASKPRDVPKPPAVPAPPTGLKQAGQLLWRSIIAVETDTHELDARELHALARACRCADDIAALEASIDEHGVMVRGSRNQPVVNRALEEARLTRLAEARLLATIKLAPEEPETPMQARARKAAEARWRYEGEEKRAR